MKTKYLKIICADKFKTVNTIMYIMITHGTGFVSNCKVQRKLCNCKHKQSKDGVIQKRP